LLGDDDDGVVSSSTASTGVANTGSSSSAAAPAEEEDLLGIGFGSGGSSSSAASSSSFVPVSLSNFAAPAPAPAPISILPTASLDPGSFQSKWTTLPTSLALNLRAARLPATAEVETMARNGGLFTIASGDVQTALKFYFYAQDSTGGFHLFEMLLDKTNGVISGTLKSENAAATQAAYAALAAALRPLPLV
jgi:hypothetical protein